jgi:hypothetical protein
MKRTERPITVIVESCWEEMSEAERERAAQALVSLLDSFDEVPEQST